MEPDKPNSRQGIDALECDACHKSFGATRSLIRHKREQHGSKDGTFMETCFICEKKVPKSRLMEHFRSHGGAAKKVGQKAISKTNKFTLSCAQCPTKFCSLDNLRLHMKGQHGIAHEKEHHQFDDEAGKYV